MFEKLSVNASFKKSIETAVMNSRLSHALIFEGGDSDTRLAAAKETAKALVCKGDNRPCGICSCCFKAGNDSHPDIHILKKSDDSTMIKVDEIRDLRAKALVYPNESAKSVFIIDGAQFMNPQAQNALLKIFEEPSPHVCFVLTCDSKSSLLDTVISRATVYSLGEEKNSAEKSEEELLAEEKAREFINTYIRESEFDFLKKTAVFLKDKSFFKVVLEKMLPLFRDALILQSGGRTDKEENKEEVFLIKNQLTQKKTLELIEKINELITDVNSSANHNLTITRFASVLYSIKSR